MSDTVIYVENLSKRYVIGALQEQPDTIRDMIVGGLKGGLQRAAGIFRHRGDGLDGRKPENSIWALQDVSLEIKRGEVMGIIGRNGAGKSTLLKILSRITEPTEGRVILDGRVGSLLEVGTGFHPELTGRENIYLNGTILGMHKAEIDRKFDEIVEFSEIGQFLDTPVKRYSSGMYVRLAFAVAAHLEPEILVVDEVLAVGDAAFQKKCLGKMEDVSKQGRTVLFVSHNMQAVQRLCTRAILLKDGRKELEGATREVVAEYLATASFLVQPEEWIDLADARRDGTGEVRFKKFLYTSLNETVGCTPYSNGPLEVTLAVEAEAPKSVGSFGITLYDQNGTKLVNTNISYLGRVIQLNRGTNQVKVRIDHVHLTPGIYTLGLWAADSSGDIYDHVQEAARLEIVNLGSEWYGTKGDGLVTCTFEILER
jgi:ABC-type polysaccharide/polyol phosphate transport system ATPase subunit